MTVIINHDRYGMKTSFETLDDATRAIRACGPEFARVELRAERGNVYDHGDVCIGYVRDDREYDTYDEVLLDWHADDIL